MTRHTLTKWFIENYPGMYRSMCESDHNIGTSHINPYHAEGSVWTHTMMVMTWLEAQYRKDPGGQIPQTRTTLLTAALLHDIGKPLAEVTKEASSTLPKRKSFPGHEGLSTHSAVGVLKDLQKDFPEEYDDAIVEKILEVIGTHGVFIEGDDSYLKELRVLFREADKMGAVREEDVLTSQYPGRNFVSPSNTPSKKVTLMVGLPCSGKSSYIAAAASNFTVVSRDSYLFEWCKDNPSLTTYSDVYKWVHEDPERLRSFNNAFDRYVKEAAAGELDVVVDMTMMTLNSRRTMLRKFRDHSWHAIVMMTDNDTIQKRNEERAKDGKFIPPKVLFNMASSFVYPVKEEGFESINLVIN